MNALDKQHAVNAALYEIYDLRARHRKEVFDCVSTVTFPCLFPVRDCQRCFCAEAYEKRIERLINAPVNHWTSFVPKICCVAGCEFNYFWGQYLGCEPPALRDQYLHRAFLYDKERQLMNIVCADPQSAPHPQRMQ